MTRFLAFFVAAVFVVGLWSVTHRHTPHSLAAATPMVAASASPVRAVAVASRQGKQLGAGAVTRRDSRSHRTVLNWAALALCESSGHWHDNTGNGYYGGTQTLEFWRSWGGLRYAARADLATRVQQITVALAGWTVRGAEPWPSCGWHL